MTTRSRGVSRTQWLDAAFHELRERGVDQLSVEGMARSLGIAKAGFYWHFDDRSHLLRELLADWSRRFTEVISRDPEISTLEPRARLVRIAERILNEELSRYELPIRHWALHDPAAARVVRRVDRIRFEFVEAAFAELGFRGDDLEMRARIFVAYESLEAPFFGRDSKRTLRALIRRRVALLTSR